MPVKATASNVSLALFKVVCVPHKLINSQACVCAAVSLAFATMQTALSRTNTATARCCMHRTASTPCVRPTYRQAYRPFSSPTSITQLAPVPTQTSSQRLRHVCRAEATEQVPVALPRTGFFISKTEVPAFIPRDDMMDQMVRWALIEADEGGQRNFGMPMKVHQRFRDGVIWGFDLEIMKEGVKQADMSVGFDAEMCIKSEWVGQDANGMPTMEGKQEEVAGKHFEIWKTCDRKVDEDLRATIRAFCTGLVAALNKYYAFGSVFAEEV